MPTTDATLTQGASHGRKLDSACSKFSMFRQKFVPPLKLNCCTTSALSFDRAKA
jgi:hypothetical protein